MQWEGICEFVALAQTGSFTKAAKQLKVSTAQVSRQVKALEERLGVTLVYRTTRQVSLTSLGQTYANECQQVLQALEQAQSQITQFNPSPSGQLRISAPTAYGERHLAPLITDFCTLHPKLHIELILTNQTIDLTKDKIDLSVRLGQLEDSSIRAKKLRNRKLYLCASPSYLQAHGYPQSLTDLKQHACLLGSLGLWRFIEQDEQGQTKQVQLKLAGPLTCNNGFVLLDAVKKGLGIAQLPDYYVEKYIQSGQLVSILEPFQPKQDGVWAVYPNSQHLAPSTRVLLEFLDKHLPLSHLES
ncbi:MAG: LysR family transcriptional regulator [Vibrio sp.]